MGGGYRNPPTELSLSIKNVRSWAKTGDIYMPIEEASAQLPAGAYRCRISSTGPYVEKMAIEADTLISLPDSAAERLLAEFNKFWTLQEVFHSYGFLFKRGFLLWGPPGSGKTSAVWQMTAALIAQHNGIIVFVDDPQPATTCIGIIRKIEPERPMIIVMEDLDALVKEHGDHEFLALLDGETQVAGVVALATTNYPEALDRRFTDRPSRFDTIQEIAMPSETARRIYLQAKTPSIDEVTLTRWVRRTAGYSVAHLREVIVSIKCFGKPEEEVFERLDSMRDSRPESDGTGGKRHHAGFSRQ